MRTFPHTYINLIYSPQPGLLYIKFMADSGGCGLDVAKIMTIMIITPTNGTVRGSSLVAQLIKDANVGCFFSPVVNYTGRYEDV